MVEQTGEGTDSVNNAMYFCRTDNMETMQWETHILQSLVTSTTLAQRLIPNLVFNLAGPVLLI